VTVYKWTYAANQLNCNAVGGSAREEIPARLLGLRFVFAEVFCGRYPDTVDLLCGVLKQRGREINGVQRSSVLVGVAAQYSRST